MLRQLHTIWRILVSPGAGFADILARPRAGLVILLTIGSALAAHVAIHARIDFPAQQRLTAAELARDQAGQEVSDEEVLKTAQRALNLRRLGGYLLYLVGVPLVVTLASLAFWLLLAAWSEGLGFRRCFRLVAHLGLPFLIRQLASLAVILRYETIDPAGTWGLFKTNLGALLGPAAFPAAWLIDPFWIWTGILAGLAGRAMGRPRWRCVLVGVIFWLALSWIGRGL